MIELAEDFADVLPKTAVASALGISRSSLYRDDDVDRDADLRDAIYAITMDWPRYGNARAAAPRLDREREAGSAHYACRRPSLQTSRWSRAQVS